MNAPTEEFFLHACFIISQTIVISWSSTECYYSKIVYEAINSDSPLPEIPFLINNNDLFLESCLLTSSPVFCPSMITHQISVLALYIIFSVDYHLARFHPNYFRFVKKIEYIEAVTLLVFWISLSIYSVYFLANFVNLYGDSFVSGPENPECLLTTFSFFISSFYFFFYCFVILIVLIGSLYTFYLRYRRINNFRKRKQKLEQKLNQILEKVYTENQELEQFYSANREELRKYDLFDVELRVFKDQFEIDYEKCSNDGYNQCSVCFGEDFEAEEKVVQFPGCHHGFHYECLEGWIKKQALCPICRRSFRDGFVYDMVLKMRNNFVREMPAREAEEVVE